MNSLKQTQLSIIKAMILVNLVVMVVSFIVFENPLSVIVGMLFGSGIGILNFMQLANTLQRAVWMDPEKAKVFATSRYFIRFIITGIVLYIAIMAPYMNTLATVFGILAIKGVIYATQLFNDKQYFKNIFIRKEDETNGR